MRIVGVGAGEWVLQLHSRQPWPHDARWKDAMKTLSRSEEYVIATRRIAVSGAGPENGRSVNLGRLLMFPIVSQDRSDAAFASMEGGMW
jgi:hypothetical protein